MMSHYRIGLRNFGASEIAEALNGKSAGNSWTACCPAHNDARPSLSISEGKSGQPLFYCHAGCSQGSVLAALKERGIWNASKVNLDAPRLVRQKPRKSEANNNAALAMGIWGETIPLPSTLSECYLQSRYLDCPNSENLRHHSALWHQSKSKFPALVARVEDPREGHFLGVHRTYLNACGTGKAEIFPAKAMLGPCKGGIVRLGPKADKILIGEGIETCLSAMQATGVSSWAALSTSGLKVIKLPNYISEVTILCDADIAGEKAAETCAKNIYIPSRKVKIARPPTGMDFNDLLAIGTNNYKKVGE